MTTQLTDGQLVRQAQDGDLSAFSELYDRWFGRVYDYVLRMSRNAEDAADLAQDTFLRAMQNLDQLEQPDAFRGWLFAIARSQTVNRVRQRDRATPVAAASSADQPDSANPLLSLTAVDAASDPAATRELQEDAELVWEAATSLDERTYTVLDLHVRHGLQSAELAEVLGTSKQTASMLINRMRTRVGDAIGTYLLMRKGSRRCDDLNEIVRRCDIPPVTRADRRKVDRHAKNCETCTDTRRKLVAPHQVFGALALVAAPAGLQQAIRTSIADSWDDSGPSSAQPGPPRRALPSRGRVLVAVGVVAALAVVMAVVLSQTLGNGDGGPEGSETAVETESSPAATADPTATQSPTDATPTVESRDSPTADSPDPPAPPTADPTGEPAAPPAGPDPTDPAQPTPATPLPSPQAEPTDPAESPEPTESPTPTVTPTETPTASPDPAGTPTGPIAGPVNPGPLVPVVPDPVILRFGIEPSPATCSGAFVEAFWAAQNTDSVTISIDGPGVYGSYGSSGRVDVPFPCDGASHSYMLTAIGPQESVTRIVVVHPA